MPEQAVRHQYHDEVLCGPFSVPKRVTTKPVWLAVKCLIPTPRTITQDRSSQKVIAMVIRALSR